MPWRPDLPLPLLEELTGVDSRQIPTLSLILLTHATTSHLAAYAYCCKNFPLFTRIPVYATRPVIDLGRTLIQDLYASTPLAATTISRSSLTETSFAYSQNGSSDQTFLLQSPTPEEIARYFSLVQALKYSQPHQPLPSPFSPPLNGLTITAYNSGHTLGGTIWHIQHGLESIVYAVDWNQARENVFSGAAWLGGAGAGGDEVIEQLRKPTALVCSSRGGDKVAPAGGRAKRDEHLVDMIKLGVSRGGTVLIPVDSSARVLEISYLLEHAWRADVSKGGSVLKAAKLFLCGRNISSTMRYARSMLEWMDDNIIREFEAVTDGRRMTGAGEGKQGKEPGPFEFKYLRLLERKAQVEKLLGQDVTNVETEGRVILASDSRNLVILTETPGLAAPEKPSLARTLWEWWNERRDGVSVEHTASGDSVELVWGGGREITISNARRQALQGDDLTAYQQWLATQRQLQATLQGGGSTAMDPSADAVDDVSSVSSSESESSETEQQGKALNISATMGQASRKKFLDEDLGINVLIKKKSMFDYDVQAKSGREKLFPLVVRRKRDDFYGDTIRPEAYVRAEEREEADGPDGHAGRNGDDEDGKLGKKRKWDEVGFGKGKSWPNKRPQISRTISDDVDVLAADSERMPDDLDAVEDGEDEEDIQGPSKLCYSTEKVMVNMRIAFVDFGGIHDKRSLNMLIPLIQPRKLILVAGNKDETMALAAECRKALAAQRGTDEDDSVAVYTPEVGTFVDASMDTNAWVVKLADTLVKKLQWQKVRGLGIVTITGQLLGKSVEAEKTEKEDGANKRLKTEDGEAIIDGISAEDDAVDVVPTLDMLPSSLTSAVRSNAPSLHVGDLRLTDLRRGMQQSGHTAEFRGEGTLVIDGSVVVRKTVTGKIELETIGTLDMGMMMQHRNTFQEVRQLIYDGLAVVAGA
jgi:cleavage and polyadenylation specificity factor subunit 2